MDPTIGAFWRTTSCNCSAARSRSSFRQLPRPEQLLPRPRPPLLGQECHIPHAWQTDLVGVSRRRARETHPDPDTSDDSSSRARWQQLIREWAAERQERFTADISHLLNEDEPLPDEAVSDLNAELACFRTAALAACYLSPSWEPFVSVLAAIEEDIDALLLDQAQRNGPFDLLRRAEGILPGLTSFRCLMHAMSESVHEADRRTQALLDGVARLLEWNTYLGTYTIDGVHPTTDDDGDHPALNASFRTPNTPAILSQ